VPVRGQHIVNIHNPVDRSAYGDGGLNTGRPRDSGLAGGPPDTHPNVGGKRRFRPFFYNYGVNATFCATACPRRITIPQTDEWYEGLALQAIPYGPAAHAKDWNSIPTDRMNGLLRRARTHGLRRRAVTTNYDKRTTALTILGRRHSFPMSRGSSIPDLAFVRAQPQRPADSAHVPPAFFYRVRRVPPDL